jgi:hypothetical protein
VATDGEEPSHPFGEERFRLFDSAPLRHGRAA